MNQNYTIFTYVVWFIATYYVVLFLVILFSDKKKIMERKKPYRNYSPFVSIIIPAYNEEESIIETIDSLKKLDYPNIEFIIVNDGSKDRTSEIVRAAIAEDKKFILIDNTTNKGKAKSLNEGIAAAKGEFIATIDADSVVEPAVIRKVLPYFSNKVGAVTITVDLKSIKTLLDKIIELEFAIGLSLFMKILSTFNSVFVTPGPFSIYRASVLRKIGGFDPNSITEDLEIAYRIHKAGHKIDNCFNAKVKTQSPPNLKAMYVQRRRWYTGALLTVIQHRNMLFNPKYGFFGFIVPYTFLLIISGLGLFLMTIYLLFSNLISLAQFLQYVNNSTIQRILEVRFDILTISGINIVGIMALFTSISLIVIGLFFTGKSIWKRKMGVFAFPLLFFLYQFYWMRAILAVISGRTTKWR